MACPSCKGIGWVCERHPDRPFDGSGGCTCGGGEIPCPALQRRFYRAEVSG